MNLISSLEKDGTLIQGEYIQPNAFCLKNFCKGKCKVFYESLRSGRKNGFVTCPFGLSVYIRGEEIYTCMRERDTYDKTKAKVFQNTKEKVYNPILDEEQILKLIEHTNHIKSESKEISEKKASIDGISHEVKQLNTQIKEKCDVILQTYHLEDEGHTLSSEDLKKLQEMVQTIYVSSCMISSRFSLYDYEKGSKLNQGTFNCDIYKKFDKIKKIFKNYMKKSVPINIVGSTYAYIKATPFFEFIPLLIIENAIKYSYANNPVDIEFKEENDGLLIVTVSSYGPYNSKEEIENIFSKGYRGKHAKKISDGAGIGLYFVKLLCEAHKIDIMAESDNRKITPISGVNYAPFKITLKFLETFYA